jgi:hypothetical protein
VRLACPSSGARLGLAALECREAHFLRANCDRRHFILESGNALWTGQDSSPPTTPAAVQAFTDFTVAMMSHFAGMGILWEIQNEADLRAWNVTQYAALLSSIGKAVRANPAIASELLVGPSTSTVACEYVQVSV